MFKVRTSCHVHTGLKGIYDTYTFCVPGMVRWNKTYKLSFCQLKLVNLSINLFLDYILSGGVCFYAILMFLYFRIFSILCVVY